jgi:hypothetical protein
MAKMTGGGAGSSGGDTVERSRRTEGGGSAESGGRAEGSFGSREGSTGGGSGRGTMAITHNGALGLKLTIPVPASIVRTTSGSSTQSKGKRKVTEEGLSTSQDVWLSCFIHR